MPEIPTEIALFLQPILDLSLSWKSENTMDEGVHMHHDHATVLNMDLRIIIGLT